MLSTRGAAWAKVGFLHGKQNAYHPIQNPNGVIALNNAENGFLHADLANFFNKHNHFEDNCCAYGEGYTGTLRLRTAMSNHLNSHFQPVWPIDPEDITFTAGVTDLNEVCALVTCNPETDAIMLGGPVYGTFSKDLALRTGIKLEWVPVGTDQFTPDCVATFDAGFEDAKARGVNIRALIICNPHNPLGRCYPPETLRALLQFCASKGIHLISDEIYALTTYPRDDQPSEKFTSIRAIDYSDIIGPTQVHVLYGMSKDYGAAGLRLGCLVSQNREFRNAVRAICRFSSPSQFSMDLAAKFLEDQNFVKQLLDKSHRVLFKIRLLAEKLLDEAGLRYEKKGNAGLFMWLDLSPQLPLSEADGDGWAAEKLLSERFTRAGVKVDPGAEYQSPEPGRFRLMFCVEEDTLREGLRRIATALKAE
ncbi:hypothetical protein TRIATDRAFT_316156 [Trichoderma atroviride IMI 206040]|uniref:Aminotransferase class I/classII large domain-containing protein n=1 Tax=Hypocrea atroviridis (strain ATCC 20476 / IMI 206040) TaxID=452589 RepID=G9NM91_HYPAI|nr:uncharacterized protein TRIATDRAFT_316156 [Trichoderma atroviride IMI 206040]EHK48023.1 hypothetical protein TRIATDRAFT_316156 [Trichoderma atroviride IMI 206040]